MGKCTCCPGTDKLHEQLQEIMDKNMVDSEVTSMVTCVMMMNYSAPTWSFPQKRKCVTACTDTLLPEYEIYLHVQGLQVELTQITLIYRTP